MFHRLKLLPGILGPLLALALAPTSASASNAGRAFGGTTCGTAGCHGPATAGLGVTIDGPVQLTPGETGEYTITMEQMLNLGAGVNVALYGGGMLGVLEATTGLLASEISLGQQSPELTHRAGASFLNQGIWSYRFAVTAPAEPTTLTLRGAMNAFNGNFVADDGDVWNTAPDFLIQVVPEPGTVLMLAGGLVALGAARFRRRAPRG